MPKEKPSQESQKEEMRKKVEQALATEDLKRRTEAFNKELIPLLGKHKIGLGAEPILMKNAKAPVGSMFGIGARPVLFDDSNSKENKELGTKKPTDQITEA